VVGRSNDATEAVQHETLSAALYELIRSGELSPGEKVDQRVVSARLAVSRTPLREALRALAADGALTHTPNQGYVVAKLSIHDLMQYYTLRDYLETQLLTSMEWPDASQMSRLRAAEQACVDASASGNASLAARRNRDFHFVMFSWSPLAILRAEGERVWRVSEAYRILHLADHTRHAALLQDHAEMVVAIDRQDLPALLELMDRHRGRTRATLETLAGPNGAFRPMLR